MNEALLHILEDTLEAMITKHETALVLAEDEEYCKHCEDTLEECGGYKCWIK